MRTFRLVLLIQLFFFLSLTVMPAQGSRIKDLCTVRGFRTNTLTGFGIVIGLNGTGDDASSTLVTESLSKLLKRLGISVNAKEIKAKNVAAVMVTAELPPFARAGSKIDVTISSMGSAKSLEGGTLIATSLKAANLRTFAIAQGSVSTGGFTAAGASGSSTRKNHVTVARIPLGATLEFDAPNLLATAEVTLLLKEPDFTTATRIADAIDLQIGPGMSRVKDPGAVTILVPESYRSRVIPFVAVLETIEAEPDAPARVIVDERTGTVVVGQHVRLYPAAVASGGLEVSIQESSQVSQPEPLARGKSVTSAQTNVDAKELAGDLHNLPQTTTISDVVAALNLLGVKPRDLVAILQALKAAGALRADIVTL